MQHKMERSEMIIKLQSENLKERDHWQDQGTKMRRILKQKKKKKVGGGGLD
jgi:hypothetical protein